MRARTERTVRHALPALQDASQDATVPLVRPEEMEALRDDIRKAPKSIRRRLSMQGMEVSRASLAAELGLQLGGGSTMSGGDEEEAEREGGKWLGDSGDFTGIDEDAGGVTSGPGIVHVSRSMVGAPLSG